MRIAEKGMKISVLFRAAVLTMVIAPLMASAQIPGQAQREVKEDFSENELESFVDVVKVQQESQMKMVAAIEEEGLDLKTFNQLAQGQTQSSEISEDERKKFSKVSTKVNQLQQKMQQNMTAKMSENNLEMEEFSEMMYAYQNSQKVRQKVDMLLAQQ